MYISYLFFFLEFFFFFGRMLFFLLQQNRFLASLERFSAISVYFILFVYFFRGRVGKGGTKYSWPLLEVGGGGGGGAYFKPKNLLGYI